MSTLPDPQKQHYSGTYFVQDRRNEEELLRLAGQDRLVTASMGGVLAEQADPSAFRRVLDVACGSGGWQQGLEEIQRFDFSATWNLLTAWGIKPKPESHQPQPE